MGLFSVVLAAIIGVLANIGYVVFKRIDYFNELSTLNDEECFKISCCKGPEDLVIYGRFVITGHDNRESLWGKEDGALHTLNGGLSVIDLSTRTSYDISILNLPDVAFHPHGMHLVNNSTLYVINHAYSRGGERVEKLRVSEEEGMVKIEYLESILFTTQHYGRINSVRFVSEKDFYATDWLPWSDTPTGRSNNIIESYWRLGTWLFRQSTYIYHCKVIDGKAECDIQGHGYMINGLEVYGDKVFASDAIDKKLYIYSRQPDNSLYRIQSTSLPLHPDNIILSPYDNYLYLGCFSRVIDDLGHHEAMARGIDVPIPGGVLKVSLEDYSVQTILLTSKLSGISSAVATEHYLLAGSWTDSGVLACRINN